MTDLAPDPQQAYEALAEALRRFHDSPDRPPAQALAALESALAQATEVWQRCESVRATQGKEFRYHVVKLKLLLAGAAQTFEEYSDAPLPEAA